MMQLHGPFGENEEWIERARLARQRQIKQLEQLSNYMDKEDDAALLQLLLVLRNRQRRRWSIRRKLAALQREPRRWRKPEFPD
jgi:hypothetical protein